MSQIGTLFDASIAGPSTPIHKKVTLQNGKHAEVSSPEITDADVDTMASDMLEYVMDMAVLEEVFCEHREASMMSRFATLEFPQPSTSTSVDAAVDHSPLRKQYEVRCPECGRNIAATRFAPHLDKCIGMGRNSSRAARQKMQQGNEDSVDPSSNSHSEEEPPVSNDDDDVDWTAKRKRRGKGKGGVKYKKRKDTPS